MKKVREALSAYIENAYFRITAIQKQRGADVNEREKVEDDLAHFLAAIPDYIQVEDDQYEAILRFIDARMGHVDSPQTFPPDVAISLLTYINTCCLINRQRGT